MDEVHYNHKRSSLSCGWHKDEWMSKLMDDEWGPVRIISLTCTLAHAVRSYQECDLRHQRQMFWSIHLRIRAVWMVWMMMGWLVGRESVDKGHLLLQISCLQVEVDAHWQTWLLKDGAKYDWCTLSQDKWWCDLLSLSSFIHALCRALNRKRTNYIE